MEQTVFVGLIELNISDPAAILKPDFLPGTLPPNPLPGTLGKIR